MKRLVNAMKDLVWKTTNERGEANELQRAVTHTTRRAKSETCQRWHETSGAEWRVIASTSGKQLDMSNMHQSNKIIQWRLRWICVISPLSTFSLFNCSCWFITLIIVTYLYKFVPVANTVFHQQTGFLSGYIWKCWAYIVQKVWVANYSILV